MCPIYNMEGCFSAFRHVHDFLLPERKRSASWNKPGLAKQVSSPALTSAFKKACAPFTDVSPFFLLSSDLGLEAERLWLSKSFAHTPSNLGSTSSQSAVAGALGIAPYDLHPVPGRYRHRHGAGRFVVRPLCESRSANRYACHIRRRSSLRRLPCGRDRTLEDFASRPRHAEGDSQPQSLAISPTQR